MIKKVSIAVLALLASLTLSAQTGGIKGTVVSRGDRAGISDARLVLYQGAQELAELQTASDGSFFIPNLEDGLYSIDISAPDFFGTRVNVAVDGGHIRNLFSLSLSRLNAETADDRFEEFDMGDSGFHDTPAILFAQNDVFNSIAGYNFSSVRFNPRGYSSETQDVYLAGVRMNDAITGYSPFSLWSGLNEATRTKYDVTGNAVSDYGIGGFNGLTNIPANASNVRKGWRGSILTNSALYRLRLMLTYASGMKDNGWAYAFSVSARLGGNDWIKGVYYRSFGYYGSVEKQFDDAHRIGLTFFGTPGSRGAQNASTQEVYDLMGDNMYNSNWGYQAGRVRNSRVRNTHEPIAILRYDYTPSDDFKLGATVLYRFGFNGYTALDWYDAQDPRPDYYRNLPSYFWMENRDFNRRNTYKYAAAKEAWTHASLYPEMTHVNWDRLYDVNRNSIDEEGNARSKYVQEERHVDQRDLNFALNFKWRPAPWAILTGGLDAKMNRTENYKIVKDLLGGDYYIDIDSFAEREWGSSEERIQNDLDWYMVNGSARILKQGDKFGYDYLAQIRKANAWFNGTFSAGIFDAHIGGRIGYAAFWRDGLVRKGLFPGQRPDGTDYYSASGVNLSRDAEGNLLPTSYGKSDIADFLTYAVKAGVGLLTGGHSKLSANAGYFNDAPNFNMAFLSPRTRNSMVEDLTTVKTFSSDLNWQYTGGGVNARITAYYTKIMDQTDVMSAYDDLQKAFSNFALSGIDQRHYGLELGFKVPTFIPNIALQGVLALGRYEYTSNPTMVQTVDNSAAPVEYNGSTVVDIPYWKSHPVQVGEDADGNAIFKEQQHYVPSIPQLAASLGLAYNHNYWFIDADVEYFDEAYLDMNPLYRTQYAVAGPDKYVTQTEIEYMTAQEKFDPCFLVNLSIGKSWYIQRTYQLGFSLNAKNLLNNRNVKTGGYEQTRLVDNTVGKERYYRFDPKYFYMSGVNYMLNIYFRF